MLLTNGGTTIQAKFLAGTLSETTRLHGAFPRLLHANALNFGDDSSWPQGHPSVLNARVPPFAIDSGQAAVELNIDLSLLPTPTGIAQGAASMAADMDLTATVNNLLSGSATLTFSVDLTAGPRGFAQGTATLDWAARPSAGDISQEIWNSFAIEGGLSGAAAMRILLAVAAGKTDIAGSGPTVVTFRDQADTKDRVRAEMTGSERGAVTVDGA